MTFDSENRPVNYTQNNLYGGSGDVEAKLQNIAAADKKDVDIGGDWDITLPREKRWSDCRVFNWLKRHKNVLFIILMVVLVSAVTSIAIVYSHKDIVVNNCTKVQQEQEQHMRSINKKVTDHVDSLKSINNTVQNFNDVAAKKFEDLEDGIERNDKALSDIKEDNEKKFQDMDFSMSKNDNAIYSMKKKNKELQNLLTKLQGDITKFKAEIEYIRNDGVKTVTATSLILLLALIAMMANL